MLKLLEILTETILTSTNVLSTHLHQDEYYENKLCPVPFLGKNQAL